MHRLRTILLLLMDIIYVAIILNSLLFVCSSVIWNSASKHAAIRHDRESEWVRLVECYTYRYVFRKSFDEIESMEYHLYCSSLVLADEAFSLSRSHSITLKRSSFELYLQCLNHWEPKTAFGLLFQYFHRKQPVDINKYAQYILCDDNQNGMRETGEM